MLILWLMVFVGGFFNVISAGNTIAFKNGRRRPYNTKLTETELSPSDHEKDKQVVEEYQFQVGDEFDISFFENDNLNQTVIVRPDGKISLPLLENIFVLSLTPSQLDEIITERYREKLRKPEVTIILRQFAVQKVYIAGEIFNPGVIQLTRGMTLLQSIFHAGGFKNSAKLKSVIVIRNNDNKPELNSIDIDKILYKAEDRFLLQPYDVIYVPKTVITKVDDFVDQYINKLMPDFIRAGFNFVYNLNDTTTTRIINVEPE